MPNDRARKNLQRILKNRQFIGAFIADPERAIADYRVSLPAKDLAILQAEAARLFKHASRVLVDGSLALLGCSRACVLNC